MEFEQYLPIELNCCLVNLNVHQYSVLCLVTFKTHGREREKERERDNCLKIKAKP